MSFPVLKQVAAAVALVGAMGAASATPTYTTNFGALTTTVSADVSNIDSGFNNLYSFSLPTGGVTGTLFGIDTNNLFSGTFEFGSSNTPTSAITWSTSVPFGSIDADPSDGSFSYSGQLTGLSTTKTYWIHLYGTASDGAYALTLAPVPEPETYAMLLAGLGLMGTIARRRSAAKTVEGA